MMTKMQESKSCMANTVSTQLSIVLKLQTKKKAEPKIILQDRLISLLRKVHNNNNTLKKSYKRPPHIFSSISESKLRSIKIHDQINKTMTNSGSESVCIPKCVICLTQSKHE